MSTPETLAPGTLCWFDLTVEDAPRIRDFYKTVVGWTSQEVDMGEYADYSMLAPGTGAGVAGVCHARGVNADIPPQWLMYIVGEDVRAAAARCVELGGKIVAGPRVMGKSGFCVIQDPAGATCALFQQTLPEGAF